MNGIRMIAESVCITLIITGIFSLLIPSNTLEKVIKFAIGLFFISSLVLPFTKQQLDFSFDFQQEQQSMQNQMLEQGVENYFITIAEQKLESQIQTLLESNQIFPESVRFQIHIAEDNSIDINEICVTLSEKYQFEQEKVISLIEKEAGLVPKVVIKKC